MYFEYLDNHVVRIWKFPDDFSTYSEEYYVSLNDWCVAHLGYHARTAYERFKFRSWTDQKKFLDYVDRENSEDL